LDIQRDQLGAPDQGVVGHRQEGVVAQTGQGIWQVILRLGRLSASATT